MSVHYRQAASEDSGAVSPLLYASSPDLVDLTYRFGDESPLGFVQYCFDHNLGMFARRWQWVGIGEGRPVAVLTTYPGHQFTRIALETMFATLRYFGLRRSVHVIRRAMELSPLFIRPRRDGAFIANGYVDPTFRKPGVFASLVEHAETIARADKLRFLECDVSFWNERSRKVHEFLGFRVREERAYHGTLPKLDGFRRMERALD